MIWSILQSEQEMKKEFLKEITMQFSRCIDESNFEEYVSKTVQYLLEAKNTLRNIKLLKLLLLNDKENISKVINIIERKKMAFQMVREIEEMIKQK